MAFFDNVHAELDAANAALCDVFEAVRLEKRFCKIKPNPRQGSGRDRDFSVIFGPHLRSKR